LQNLTEILDLNEYKVGENIHQLCIC